MTPSADEVDSVDEVNPPEVGSQRMGTDSPRLQEAVQVQTDVPSTQEDSLRLPAHDQRPSQSLDEEVNSDSSDDEVSGLFVDLTFDWADFDRHNFSA